MKLLTDIGNWMWAVLSAWYGWVGASATAGLVGFGQGMGWWESPGKKVYIALLAIGLVISMFSAWRKEHSIAQEATGKLYDGRPVIMLEVLGQPAAMDVDPSHNPRRLTFRPPAFGLYNCGGRTARFIHVQPLTSKLGNYQMYFQDLTSLEPGPHRPIGFRVNNSGWSGAGLSNAEIAWDFFHDNPVESDPLENPALVWYDTPITFRDAGDAAMKDIVRLAFDLQRGILYVTAVPYTQKPPDKGIEGVTLPS
jgi:hypothetical protein